jgi:hypothetical protein
VAVHLNSFSFVTTVYQWKSDNNCNDYTHFLGYIHQTEKPGQVSPSLLVKAGDWHKMNIKHLICLVKCTHVYLAVLVRHVLLIVTNMRPVAQSHSLTYEHSTYGITSIKIYFVFKTKIDIIKQAEKGES